MHTQIRPISKKFFNTLHLFEPESEKMGVFLKRKLKSFHLFEMGNDSWGVFLKNFLKIFFSCFFGSKNSVFHLSSSNEKSLKNKNLLSIRRTERRKWA